MSCIMFHSSFLFPCQMCSFWKASIDSSKSFSFAFYIFSRHTSNPKFYPKITTYMNNFRAPAMPLYLPEMCKHGSKNGSGIKWSIKDFYFHYNTGLECETRQAAANRAPSTMNWVNIDGNNIPGGNKDLTNVAFVFRPPRAQSRVATNKFHRQRRKTWRRKEHEKLSIFYDREKSPANPADEKCSSRSAKQKFFTFFWL